MTVPTGMTHLPVSAGPWVHSDEAVAQFAQLDEPSMSSIQVVGGWRNGHEAAHVDPIVQIVDGVKQRRDCVGRHATLGGFAAEIHLDQHRNRRGGSNAGEGIRQPRAIQSVDQVEVFDCGAGLVALEVSDQMPACVR